MAQISLKTENSLRILDKTVDQANQNSHQVRDHKEIAETKDKKTVETIKSLKRKTWDNTLI